MLYLLPHLQLVVAAFALALSWVLAKAAMSAAGNAQLLFHRSIGGLMLAIAVLIQGGFFSEVAAIPRAAWPYVAVNVLLAPTAISFLAFASMRAGSVGAVNALSLVQPTFVVLINLALRRSDPLIAWIGGALSLAGAIVLARDGRSISRRAVGMGLFCAFVWALSTVVQRRALESVDKLTLLTMQNLAYFSFSSLMWGLFAIRDPRERKLAPLWAIALAIGSGVLVQVVFQYLKYCALPVVGPFVTTAIQLLQLPFTMALAYVALNERPTRSTSTAATLILGGAALGCWR